MEIFALVLGGNAAVLGALTYLLKALISHNLEKNISDFRYDLQRKADREIESYKADLERERLKLQISYGGIFEKQADAILTLYRALVDLEGATTDAIHFGGTVDERRDRFRLPWGELRRAHFQNRVLLPESIDDKLFSFISSMFSAVFGYMAVESKDMVRITDDEFEKLMQKQDRAIEIIEKEVPEIRESLICEMRRVIGVAASDL